MAGTSSGDLADTKKRLRAKAKAQRSRAAAVAPIAGLRLRDHLLKSCDDVPPDTVFSAYWPMGDEIDPVPTIEALHERGHTVGLPVMQGKDRPLVFRAWRPGDPLIDGGFGTSVPRADAPEVTPQIVLVPMLAFDRTGYRIGYGGGFYDRTLKSLREKNRRTLAIGIAYAGQEVESIPHDGDDQKLDMLVTESGPVALLKGETSAGGLL